MTISITYTIPGVPLINQLNEPTSDGQPDENTRMNCVFASNAALATAYLHKPFNGDQLKDANPHYGQGYTGGASEANMVDEMAKLGITVTRVAQPTQQGLVDELHHHIPQGHACIITMPSQWNSAVTVPGYEPRTYSGPSHVGLACGVGPSCIRVMNPWGGFWHDGDDSYWAARLLEGEIWVATLTANEGGSTNVAVPQGWTDDGVTLTAPNKVAVAHGFRDYVLAYPNGWESDNWPLAAEYYCDASSGGIEPGNKYIGRGSRQDFRYRSLGCPQNADGSWKPVYRIWTGQDIVALESNLATANTHIGQLEQQLSAAQSQVATLNSQVAALQQQIQQLQQGSDPKALALVAALKAALAG